MGNGGGCGDEWFPFNSERRKGEGRVGEDRVREIEEKEGKG